MSTPAQQYRTLVSRLEALEEGPMSAVASALTPKAPAAPTAATPAAAQPTAATMHAASTVKPNAPPLSDIFNQLTQLSDGEKANVVDALWKAYNSQSGRMGTKSLPPQAQSIIDQLTQPAPQ